VNFNDIERGRCWRLRTGRFISRRYAVAGRIFRTPAAAEGRASGYRLSGMNAWRGCAAHSHVDVVPRLAAGPAAARSLKKRELGSVIVRLTQPGNRPS
jgi:hypothetical protein